MEAEELAKPEVAKQFVILDARGKHKYALGHIPGAVNAFYGPNLNPDATFRSPQELRARFAPIVAAAGQREVVMSCGSGVSACHNLLAMEIAGLPTARLFPNSWSGWSASGEVRGADGDPPFVVRWSDGHEALLFPGPDAHVHSRDGDQDGSET